jgi:hypothetical protein
MANNILLNKTATASSYVMPYSASRAVDGSLVPVSRWLCNTLPGWLAVDLGRMYSINQWTIRHMPVAGWKSPDYVNSDFKLQGSNNNNNWYDIDPVVGNVASITTRNLNSLAVYRFFRVYVSKGLKTNPQLASIVEFELNPFFSNQLSGLILSAGTLSPVFSPTTFAYTATVDASVSSITITPTAAEPTATIKINNQVTTNAVASQPIPLNIGSNTITVNVTDGSGATTQNYTITVTRQQNVSLSALTAQSGTANVPLTPSPFASTTLAYTASVGCEISSVTVTPTAGQTGSTITVNGITVASGQPSGAISLNVGSNTITIAVTLNGVTQNYTITITRADSSYLSNLTTQSRSGAIALTPAFVKTTQSYNASVANNITGVTFTPTAENSAATIKINGTVTVVSGQTSSSFTLNEGNNTFNIAVTSGGTTFTYTVVIARAYNLLLNKIDIAYIYRGGSGSTSVTTDATNLNYSVNLPNSPSTMTIAPFAASTNVVVKVNGVVVPSGTPSSSIAVTSGMVVTITVSSPDNTQTRSYNLTVTK